MTTGLFVSLLVNIAVGFYLYGVFPRSVRKNFPVGKPPRAFVLLLAIMPTFGLILIIGSVIYGVLAIAGAFGT